MQCFIFFCVGPQKSNHLHISTQNIQLVGGFWLLQLAQLCSKGVCRDDGGCKFTSESKHSSSYVDTFKSFKNTFLGCFQTFFALFRMTLLKSVNIFRVIIIKPVPNQFSFFPQVVLCSHCVIVKPAKAHTLAGLSLRPLHHHLTCASWDGVMTTEIWSRWSHFPKVGHRAQFGRSWLKE